MTGLPSDEDFAREAMNRRGHGRDQHRAKHLDGFRTAQHRDRTSPVGLLELVRPHLAARYASGHVPSPTHAVSSSPTPDAQPRR